MKKLILIIFLFGLSGGIFAQISDKNPIASARLVATDGRSELIFDDPVVENFTVEVRDLTGKLMFSLKSDMREEGCQSVVLPIESLRRGIYMVQIIGSGGKIKTLKLQRN